MRFLESSDSETESRLVVARGWGRDSGDLIFMETGFHLHKMKRVLEMDGRDGYTTVAMCY